ncbi:hypothetical protein BDY21DRAFT_340113 [Lineolata rhizophorae]|uniref:Uncharacterized protein n=1 Tax=Lineolata rhizophorae TaxID=578093 RepID=A0A6A6P5M2_9PEZI|nr:hypothetical protein BDY21DRAFT_340113 [Lineolata rhizophorae]
MGLVLSEGLRLCGWRPRARCRPPRSVIGWWAPLLLRLRSPRLWSWSWWWSFLVSVAVLLVLASLFCRAAAAQGRPAARGAVPPLDAMRSGAYLAGDVVMSFGTGAFQSYSRWDAAR